MSYGKNKENKLMLEEGKEIERRNTNFCPV